MAVALVHARMQELLAAAPSAVFSTEGNVAASSRPGTAGSPTAAVMCSSRPGAAAWSSRSSRPNTAHVRDVQAAAAGSPRGGGVQWARDVPRAGSDPAAAASSSSRHSTADGDRAASTTPMPHPAAGARQATPGLPAPGQAAAAASASAGSPHIAEHDVAAELDALLRQQELERLLQAQQQVRVVGCAVLPACGHTKCLRPHAAATCVLSPGCARPAS
jgi:hypothetical protein